MGKYKVSHIFKGNYSVSQYYGENPSYYKQFGLAAHEGVDFPTPIGVEILVPFDEGVILRDNDDFKNNAYGDFVVVWDPKQHCAIWFCHLSENFVSYKDTVKKGQVIGKTGNTGNSSGPHLHINFVETDERGNRLNMNNGYQGFLNILDTNLVTWELGSNPAPQPPQSDMTDQEKKDIESMNKLREYNNVWYEAKFIIADFEALKKERDSLGAEIGKKDELIKNLNQLINEKNSVIIKLQSTISTQETTLLNQGTRIFSLEEQAKKVPMLEEQLKYLERRKEEWTSSENLYKKRIKTLEMTSYTTALASTLIIEILKRLLLKVKIKS